jgi:pimeloyl-ACP methyl ester carboxylesterase
MLFFDTPLASLNNPADMFTGDTWFDPATKAAYSAAYSVPGSRDSSLNWYRANIFAGRENVPRFTPTMPSTLPDNITISPPTLVLWGMGDTAFDNELNLQRLVPLVPHLTVKRYVRAVPHSPVLHALAYSPVQTQLFPDSKTHTVKAPHCCQRTLTSSWAYVCWR